MSRREFLRQDLAKPLNSPLHHLNGPSRLGRRFLCPASAQMEAHVLEQDPEAPRRSSLPALEGTALHAALARSWFDPALWKPEVEAHGIPWLEEYEELLKKCGAFLRERRFDRDYLMEKEVPIVIRDSQGLEISGGTTDVFGKPLVPGRPFLVIDWKFGRVEPSEVFTACQTAGYVAGALWEYPPGTKALAFVYDPRTETLYEFEFTREEAIARVEEIIRATEAPVPKLGPSTEACEYCTALAVCPAARELAMQAALRYYAEILTPAIAAEQLPFLRFVERWAESLRDWIREQLERGVQIRGAKLTERQGDRYVENVAGILETLREEGVSAEKLWPLMKVSATSLEDCYARDFAERTGGTIKAGKERFAAVAGHHIGRGSAKRILTISKQGPGPLGRLGEPYFKE